MVLISPSSGHICHLPKTSQSKKGLHCGISELHLSSLNQDKYQQPNLRREFILYQALEHSCIRSLLSLPGWLLTYHLCAAKGMQVEGTRLVIRTTQLRWDTFCLNIQTKHLVLFLWMAFLLCLPQNSNQAHFRPKEKSKRASKRTFFCFTLLFNV